MNPDGRRWDARDRCAAEVAWSTAPGICRRACLNYHRTRPLLRWLGLAAEPADQASFFRRHLAKAFSAGARDILVCGMSDTGMVDVVSSSTGGHAVSLTAIDLCATPLHLVRSLGVPGNVDLRTEPVDVLAWRPERRFDVIVTHSLLGHFPPDLRPALMRRWYELLEAGGLVVTINRIRPRDAGLRFAPRDTQALADESVRRYRSAGPFSGVSAEDVHAAVLDYAAGRQTSPLRSIDDLRRLLESSGLEIVTLGASTAASRVPGLGGPAVPGGATYAEVVARRA